MIAVGTVGNLRVGLGTSRLRDRLGALIRSSAAAYSLDRLNPYYGGSAIRARRSSDNVETDIGFTAAGLLDQTALLLFCDTPKQPLDAVSGAARAYSTRRVRTAYAGPCMRVRRSSDNAEQDIGFTAAGDLDTVALLAFTGAASGFVTTWYDQSLNARHATQTTAGLQPRIVNAGTVHTLNERATVDQVTTNGRLNIPAFSGMTSAIVSAVYAQAAAQNGFAPWQLNQIDHLPWTNALAYAGPFSATRPQFATWAAAANEVIVASAVQTGTAMAVYRNGTQNGATQAAVFALPSSQGNRTIFGGLTGTGFVSELIIMSAWDGGPINRQTLERSQAAYFGVTHAVPISGFVTTWYDQSGNGRDATQAAAANQPRIVNAGVVDTRNGRPAVRFLGGSQETLRHTAATTVYAGTISATMVFQMNTTTPAFARILTPRRSAGGFDWGTIGSATFSRSGSAGAVEIFSANAQRAVRAFVLDVLNQSSIQIGPSTFIGVNGSLSATSVTPDMNSDILEIGATPQANAINGFMSEVIIFTTAISTTDRQLLERSQGARFGITLA